MISASHNPFEFNGIKIFSMDGYKLPDDLEEEIESIVLDHTIPYPELSGSQLGHVKYADSAVADYVSHVIESVPERIDGMKIALDCSNGSASRTANSCLRALARSATCFTTSRTASISTTTAVRPIWKT